MLGNKLRRQLFAWRNDDLLVKTGFERSDEVTATAVMKDSDDGGMSAAKNSNHTTFGAGRSAGHVARIAALDASNDVIAVHGVAELIWRDEEIAVEVGARRIRNHEAVTIAMGDQPTSKQIGIALSRLRL